MRGREEGVAHGGDLEAARRRFGAPADGWLDLSTGVNPHAYPFAEIPAEAWTRLPQADAAAALLDAARAYYGAPAGAPIVAAPGTQALIQMLPRLRPAGRVAVVGPTYAEHAHVWRAAGHRVSEAASLDEAGEADVAIVVNPNNPDGRVSPRDALMALRGRLSDRGGWLVVDEAFADTDPTVSLAGEAGLAGLVLLRSFGKFFGLAGLRLGFALADEAIAVALTRAFGPWAVAGPALEIGRRALADSGWAAEMRARLAAECRRLDALLSKRGLAVVGGTSLFRLVETADANRLYERLAEAGVLTRIFAGRPRLLRFGLPGGEAAFQRLDAALKDPCR